MTEREGICLTFLNGKMEANSPMIGEVIIARMKGRAVRMPARLAQCRRAAPPKRPAHLSSGAAGLVDNHARI
jgi:hypothetical protein